MGTFLVETYVARGRQPDARRAARRLRAAARELSAEGVAVRHVRVTVLPTDEVCFHLVAADSEGAVAEVCRRAGLGSPRIVPALE